MSLLQSDEVRYNFEPIGVVVADTFENARTPPSWCAWNTRAARTRRSVWRRAIAAMIKPDEANKEPTDTHRGDFAAGMSAGRRQSGANLRHALREPPSRWSRTRRLRIGMAAS